MMPEIAQPQAAQTGSMALDGGEDGGEDGAADGDP